MTRTLSGRASRWANWPPPSLPDTQPDPTLTLALLDTQERRALDRQDWSDANRVLAERLRLKAQVLAGSPEPALSLTSEATRGGRP